MPISAPEITPISSKIQHWAQTYVAQLSEQYDIDSVFANKDLNAFITTEDFQTLVKLILDDKYNSAPDSTSREAVVYELTKVWAEKTGNDLDLIPTIKMIIYADTDQINPKYMHGVYVAYMKKIAQGNDQSIFAPKSNTTYGELATLLYNTKNAIKNELNTPDPIAAGKLETKGSHEVTKDKVIFSFELMSHYTEPKELVFGSGQQFELTITDASGKEVYRFSDGKDFTMALVYKIIQPGESFKWQDEWDRTNKEGEKLESGNYTAVIRILAGQESDEKIDGDQLMAIVNFSLGESNLQE